MNGSTAKVGRVEVCYSRQYRTVCDDSWDELEARVVCRQLDYTSGGELTHTHTGQCVACIKLGKLQN